jgi:hypothetical protein
MPPDLSTVCPAARRVVSWIRDANLVLATRLVDNIPFLNIEKPVYHRENSNPILCFPAEDEFKDYWDKLG